MDENKCISEAVKAELKEKYLAVRKLLDEDCKNDPETEPYKSKYKALEILKNMQNLLFNSVDNAEQQGTEVTAMLGVVYLNEGIVATETEELKAGQVYLMNCIDALRSDARPDTILCIISAFNQLGILWSKRDHADKAKDYLKEAETVYHYYKNSEYSNSVIVSMASLFNVQDSEEISTISTFEKLHTLTLFYLAQVYNNSDDILNSVIYCHMTLKRQLEMNDYDSIDWVLNAASLSQFFLENEDFHKARHHLAAATYILGKYEEKLKEMNSKMTEDDNEKEILDYKWENFKHRSADISRCWAKYGILLMSMSRDRLMSKIENGEGHSISIDDMKFKTIENDIEHIANAVTDKYLLDFNDAKKVFLNVQKWLDDAKLFYTLNDQASDYVHIVQDMSQVYKHLIFFEEDDNRQAKMHKRRIDMLEKVVKELNEKYYKAVCQQIWIELGETYSEILNIKLDHLKATEDRPTPHMLNKINNLTKQAIKNFNNFLDSLKEPEKDKFSDEMIRPALCSYFHLAKLYHKFITPDKKVQLINSKKSLDAYSFLVNYCEKDPKAAELMSEELVICKDFMKLLPIKINHLMQEVNS